MRYIVCLYLRYIVEMMCVLIFFSRHCMFSFLIRRIWFVNYIDFESSLDDGDLILLLRQEKINQNERKKYIWKSLIYCTKLLTLATSLASSHKDNNALTDLLTVLVVACDFVVLFFSSSVLVQFHFISIYFCLLNIKHT